MDGGARGNKTIASRNRQLYEDKKNLIILKNYGEVSLFTRPVVLINLQVLIC